MAPKCMIVQDAPDTAANFFVSNASDLNRMCAINPEVILDHYNARLDSVLARHPALLPLPLPPAPPLPSIPSPPFPIPTPDRTSFVDLPMDIQARIITLVSLVPRDISRPVKRKVTLHERITPNLNAILHLAASCRTLHNAIFGMQKLFTSVRMEIILRPDLSSFRNFERLRKNILDDVTFMRNFFGKSGGTLPLRLHYAISFGPNTPAVTIEKFNLRALPIERLICDPTFIGRWQVLDLCMPTYAPYPNLLYALAAPPTNYFPCQDPEPKANLKWELSFQASKPAFTSLRTLHLLAPYPQPPGTSVEREDAVNAFLRFSVGAPLLSSIKLDFSAPLDPLKFSRGVAVHPFFSVNSVLALHHTAEGACNPADKEKMRSFVKTIMKPLWAHRSTTFPNTTDFAPIRIAQYVKGQDVWWIGLQHLTLSTGTTTRRLFYLLAHTIALKTLNVWLGEDRSGNEMVSESKLTITLPNLTVLIVRCAADLELLRHIHTPKLEGLYIQMRYFERCKKWLLGSTPSATSGFAFKQIFGVDRKKFTPEVEKETAMILQRFFLGYTPRLSAPGTPAPTPLPLRRLKLVALPLRDAPLSELLRATPNLEELRLWWGLRGNFVEALADTTLVPRLAHLELHFAKGRVVPRLTNNLMGVMHLRGQGIKLNVTEEKDDRAAMEFEWSLKRPTLEEDGFAFVDDADNEGDRMELDADLGAPMAVDDAEIVDDDEMELEEGEIREVAPGEGGRRRLGQLETRSDTPQGSGSSSMPTDLANRGLNRRHQVRLEAAEYHNIPIVGSDPVTLSISLTKEECPCGTHWMEPEVETDMHSL